MKTFFRSLSRYVVGLLALATVLVGSVPAAHAEVLDRDTLDLSGDWVLTHGYGVGIGVDATGHWTPTVAPRRFGVHFDALGPGDHGGTKYKGHYFAGLPGTEPETRGTLFAETFYDSRGVQLVQMHSNYAPFRYYDIFAGKHQLYSGEPGRVEVLGGWVNVGHAGADSGYIGNFSMVKVGS